MKFVFPEINNTFDTEIDKVNCIIIENQNLFFKVINDIYNQSQGQDGLSVISKNNKDLSISKNAELITSFVPFDINQKNLITKLTNTLESRALSDENYAKTMELISELNSFLYNLSFDYNCDIEFPKVSISSLLKASGIEINYSDLSLSEQILDYMEISKDLLGEKLFFLVNVRSYINDKDMDLLLQSIVSHQHPVILVESTEHSLLKTENRYIIDSDLCEIST